MGAKIEEFVEGLNAWFGPGQYNLMYQMVKAMTEWKNGNSAIQLVSSLYNMLAPIAMALALCYALMEIIDALQRSGGMSNVTPDIIIMPLLKVAMCLLLIRNIPDLMGTMLGSSNSLVTQVDTMMSAPLTDFGEAQELESSYGTLAKILLEFVPSILSLIAQVIAAVIVGMQVITIRIDILIRYIFMPFAVANIAHGGVQSPGMHYLKRFLGNFLTMAALLVVIRLTFLISVDITKANLFNDASLGESVSTFMFGYIFTSVIGPFAAVGAVTSVKAAINEAFG